jgi:hypothetical protein
MSVRTGIRACCSLAQCVPDHRDCDAATLPATPNEAQAFFSAAFSILNLWCWARICSCVAPWFGTSG